MEIEIIEMEHVISTTISHVGYSHQDTKMRVRFNSGTLYEYYDVSFDEYMSILTDQSKGSKLRKVMGAKEYKKL